MKLLKAIFLLGMSGILPASAQCSQYMDDNGHLLTVCMSAAAQEGVAYYNSHKRQGGLDSAAWYDSSLAYNNYQISNGNAFTDCNRLMQIGYNKYSTLVSADYTSFIKSSLISYCTTNHLTPPSTTQLNLYANAFSDAESASSAVWHSELAAYIAAHNANPTGVDLQKILSDVGASYEESLMNSLDPTSGIQSSKNTAGNFDDWVGASLRLFENWMPVVS